MSTFTQILDEVFAQLHEDDYALYATLPQAQNQQHHGTSTDSPSVQYTIIAESHQQHSSPEDYLQLY